MSFICKLSNYQDSASQNLLELTATVVYEVISTEPVNAIQVLSAPGLPTVGDYHPSSSSIWVQKRNVKGDGTSRMKWKVEIEYSNQSDWTISPIGTKTLDIQLMEYEEEYYVDTAGQFSRLTNGKPMNPLPTRMVVESQAIIEIVVPTSYSWDNFRIYQNTTNADDVTLENTVIPAYHGRLICTLSKPTITDGTPVRLLTKRFTFSDEPKYRHRIESRDNEEIWTTDDPRLVPIIDDTGKPIDYAHPLDDVGLAQASQYDEPFIIERKPYKPMALNAFLNA